MYGLGAAILKEVTLRIGRACPRSSLPRCLIYETGRPRTGIILGICDVGHIKEYPRENIKTYADPRVIFIQVTLLCVQAGGMFDQAA